MELRSFLLFAVFAVGLYAKYSDAMVQDRHTVQRRDAYPDPDDDDLMADAADEAMNDADGGDDDEDDFEDEQEAVIQNKGEDFITKPGQTVRLPCTVNSKDVVIQWHRNDALLFMGNMKVLADDKITLQNTDLIVKDISESSVGRYKCSLAGKSLSIAHTINLALGAKIIELNATKQGIVLEGSDVEITCLTSGMPPPTLIWSKRVGEENYRLTERDVVFTTNSIKIKKIRHDEAGNYICYADNRIGSKPDARQIRIKVLGKPNVHIPKKVINTKAGVEAVLQCKVHREPDSQIEWFKDGQPVKEVEDVFTISFVQQHSNLTITPRLEKDFGTYTCKATNMYGTHEKSVRLTEEPVIENFEADGSKLSWTIHSYLPLKEMDLQIQKINGTDYRSISVPIPEENEKTHVHEITYQLTELQYGRYHVTLRVKNDHGWAEHGSLETELEHLSEPIVRGSAFGMRGSAETVQPITAIMSSLLMYILVRFV